MGYAAILQLLAVIIPAFLTFSTKVVTGNKRFVIAIVAFFILRKWATDAALDKAYSGVGGETGGYFNANALATAYRQAMNPSGFSWTMGVDGTNEDEIFELAARSRGALYQQVYNAYRTLYDSDLTKDLISELSQTDYKRFLQILNT